MRNHQITNGDDIIDSRDVIARIETLEAERQALVDAIAEIVEGFELELSEGDTPSQQVADEEQQRADNDAQKTLAENDLAAWDDENSEELTALKALAEDASGSADWSYGEALIRDSYFETYAMELAEDIGAINKDATWPNNYIDWERATDALKQDYMSVEFDGVTYWIRS